MTQNSPSLTGRLPVPALARRLLRAVIACSAVFAAGIQVRAAANGDLPPPDVLKKMTIEQLLDLDVTSVSRRREKLLAVPSAVQVITAEDVRRAGATSLPEALRLASNLEVAQIDSRQWAITARGFNNVFADKMLVMVD